MNDTRFEHCIKCTVCTTACPVSRVNPRYPGPKQAGPDGERLRLKDGTLYDEALKYCINCKRCEVACPSDVKIGDRARAHGDDVADDAAHAGGRALVGLDEGRVVVGLHLEGDGPAAADVDDAGVLAHADEEVLPHGVGRARAELLGEVLLGWLRRSALRSADRS